jgi:hypothetical protein
MSEASGPLARSAGNAIYSSFKFPLIFQFQSLSGREGITAEGRTTRTAEKISSLQQSVGVVTQAHSSL